MKCKMYLISIDSICQDCLHRLVRSDFCIAICDKYCDNGNNL